MRKILIICPYPFDVQAGQRLKYEQHINCLKANGFYVKISPFIHIKMWKILYKKGHYINKIFFTLFGYFKRIIDIFFLKKYDIVYIFLWVTPFGGSFFERIFRILSNKILYDIEDNILEDSNNKNSVNFNFRSSKKIFYLIKNADSIICSSPDLRKKCITLTKKNNCYFIPPSLNPNKYIPKTNYSSELVVVGWTGTFSSIKYLEKIIPILEKVSTLRKFKLLIIGNFNFHNKIINYELINWNKKNEINDLQKIDIGLYPLIKDTWIIGKSGLKAMQYMALGIPTIASNFGNVKNFINNNENGILVNNDEEWYSAILKMIDNKQKRKTLGIEGKKTFDKKFAYNQIQNKYLEIINKL